MLSPLRVMIKVGERPMDFNPFLDRFSPAHEPDFPGFPEGLFRFLQELKAHNDRGWFAEHRAEYERYYRQPAMSFCAAFASRLRQASIPLVSDPRRSPFRIYRDVRFSANKDPYKTHLGLYFPVLWEEEVGLYLHLEPGNSFLAAGSWSLDSEWVRRLRRLLAERYSELEAIVGEVAFKARFQIRGERLRRPPPEYGSAHPAREWLLHRQFYAQAAIQEREACRPEILDRLLEDAQRLWPLLELLAPREGSVA